MKPNIPSLKKFVSATGWFALLVWLALNLPAARADDSTTTANPIPAADTDEAAKAWKEVRKAIQPPMPPAEWQTNQPTREVVAKFYSTFLFQGADKARDFYTRFPNDPKASAARSAELNLLNIAAEHYGDTTHAGRLAALETAQLNDPNSSEDDKFKLRIGAVQRMFAGLPGNEDEVLKSARLLQKDFPQRDEVYEVMLMVLERSQGDQARALAKEIIDSHAPDGIKSAARGALKGMDSLGKPLDIQYTAVDGRPVDLTKMKGKVVLVDFWATWCGPCMGELPNVKAAYAKLHDKGFEIVGISFDQDRDALQKTLKEKEMTWPQYFDGQGWKNKYGQEFGINSIPTMWLVDKKGNLCDMNARGELEDKVTKLLAQE